MKYQKPYYDPFTDKIHNVDDKNTEEYHHEYKHKLQNQNRFIRWFNISAPTELFKFDLVMFLLLVSPFALTVLINPILYTITWGIVGVVHIAKSLFVAYLEIDAVIYSKDKMKHERK